MSNYKQDPELAIRTLLSTFAKAVNELFLNSPNTPAESEHTSLASTIKSAANYESLMALVDAFRVHHDTLMSLDFESMLSHASEFEAKPYMLEEQMLADLQPLGGFIEISTISSSPGVGASVSLQFTLAPTSPFLEGIEHLVSIDVMARDGDDTPANLLIGILEMQNDEDVADLMFFFNQEDGSCEASATIDGLFESKVIRRDLREPINPTQD